MRQEGFPIFAKGYAMVQWIFCETMKFPKSQRFAIATRMQKAALEFLEDITVAISHKDKLLSLARASEALERLRILGRLSKDLKFLGFSKYKHLTEMTDEVGKMLGGWIKSEQGVTPQPYSSCV